VDTCGYVPRIVRASASKLAGQVPHYTFVSSISAYADPMPVAADEGAPLATMEDEAVEEITGETYGPLKVLCEETVKEVYGEGALIIRPGLIVGPYDPTDRFTYWPVRVARGGIVLAPGAPTNPVQVIDGRDLALWMLTMVERRATGAYNATGPAMPLPMQEVLTACRKDAGSDATFTWVSDAFLLAHDVRPYVDMPLWVPGEDAEAFGTVSVAKAIASGLTFRPLRETIADTRRWAAQRGEEYEWRAGLSEAREAQLLRAWHEQKGG
jgi:2'-hydroxyisoflavone reductase